MMTCFRRISLGALALALLIGVRPVRADYFTYSTSIDVDAASLEGLSSVSNNGSNAVVVNGNGFSVNLNGTQIVDRVSGLGSGSNIVFATISVDTTESTPLVDPVGMNITFTLNLTDYNGMVGPATGTGSVQVVTNLTGSVGAGRTVRLNNLRTYATVPADGNFQVGSTTYNADLFLPGLGGANFTAPGADTIGTFGAQIRVAAVPEPSTVVLAGLGVAGLVGVRFRRRHAA